MAIMATLRFDHTSPGAKACLKVIYAPPNCLPFEIITADTVAKTRAPLHVAR
jgi:hypothetical protein